MEDKLLIDISKYDQSVDFEYWKSRHGLWGVIIKAGGNEGGRYRDSWLETHYNDAVNAGIHIGFYYYTTVTSEYEAIKDAEHFADLIGDKFFDLPCYMDVEDGYQLSIGSNALTNVIEAFCDKLNDIDKFSGLYTGKSAWLNSMNPDRLLKYADWIACWGPNWPSGVGDIGMWQKGCMDPFTGDVAYDDVGGNYTDFNFCRIDYPSKINGIVEPEPIIRSNPVQNPGDILRESNFSYQAHCQNTGWMDWVKDGQAAGTAGYSTRMEALRFKLPSTIAGLNVSTHIQNIGWKDYTDVKTDDICGTTGQGLRLEAIKIVTTGNTTGLKLRYQGHIESYGWTEPVGEGEICGTTGRGKRLEAIRIWLDDPNNPVDITGWNGIPEKDSEPEPIPNVTGRAEDVIAVAYKYLGYYAPDDPEPGSLFGRWLAELTGEDWLAGPSNEIFWCCMFASYCLYFGGVEMDGFPTQNTDIALNGGARKYAIDDIYDVQYGDVIIFNWNWDNATDHIGFATGSFDGYGFTTIEGNVGNAVQEKYRQMGNVAYVLRPDYIPYDGRIIPSVDTTPKNNRDGGKLDVDGIGGWNTIIDLQHIFGTTEDGIISGQDPDSKDYHWGMSNVEYGSGGSELVKAIQRKVGSGVDGYWGPDTSRKFQTYLNSLGYTLEVDGYFGRESVKALQDAINKGLITK